MKNVYINNTPLILCSDFNEVPQKYEKNENVLRSRYTGKTKSLLNFIDNLEKEHHYDAIVLISSNLKGMWSDFKSLYKIIKAAGGLVHDENGKILMIYRRKSMDLPKGKLEKGESKREGAIREVEEETGIKDITISKKLLNTFHTYKDRKDRRVLKKTYWYDMSAPNQATKPQIEEDIEEVLWIDPQKYNFGQRHIFKNILEVIEKKHNFR